MIYILWFFATLTIAVFIYRHLYPYLWCKWLMLLTYATFKVKALKCKDPEKKKVYKLVASQLWEVYKSIKMF